MVRVPGLVERPAAAAPARHRHGGRRTARGARPRRAARLLRRASRSATSELTPTPSCARCARAGAGSCSSRAAGSRSTASGSTALLARWREAERRGTEGVSLPRGDAAPRGRAASLGDEAAPQAEDDREWVGVQPGRLARGGARRRCAALAARRSAIPGPRLQADPPPLPAATACAGSSRSPASASAAASPTTWGSGRRCRCSRCSLLLKQRARRPGPAPPRRAGLAPRQLEGGGRALRAVAPASSSRILRRMPREELAALSPEALDGHDLVVVTYGSVHRLPVARRARASASPCSTRRRR